MQVINEKKSHPIYEQGYSRKVHDHQGKKYVTVKVKLQDKI